MDFVLNPIPVYIQPLYPKIVHSSIHADLRRAEESEYHKGTLFHN